MTTSIELEGNKIRVFGQLDRFHLGNKHLHSFPNISPKVVLCMQEVNSFDTSGLAWVLKLVKFYNKKQVELEISNPPQQLIALAKISNVLELLPISK